MRAAIEAPESWLEFRLEAGQFQCINNRQVAHSRTAFQDEGAKRHLLRLWNCDEGPPALEGS